MRYYHFVMLILVLITPVPSTERCAITTPFKRFYKIRSCHKSSSPLIGWDNFDNVYECMKFARERKGFAFNFSPPFEARNLTGYFRNCQILACPESINSTTLIPDENFDYYSAYGNLNGTENATCIKSIGLFSVISGEKSNYSNAIKVCNRLGGDLADILSETRTNHLSLLIKNSMSDWYRAAYVGLDDLEMKGTFVTPLTNLLSCSKFRAWSPGHPRKHRKNHNCVILDSERTWRTVNCKIKLPFVCEFYGQAPQVIKRFDSREENC